LDDLKAELLDGLSELKDGTKALYEGNETLNEGVHKLEEGTMSAKEGAQKLEEGTSALNDALSQAQSGSEALASGAQQVAQGNQQLANRFNEVIKIINSNGANIASSALNEKIKSYTNGANQIKGKLNELNTEIEKNKQKLVESNQQLLAAVETITSYQKQIESLKSPENLMSIDLDGNNNTLGSILYKMDPNDQQLLLKYILNQADIIDEKLNITQFILNEKINELSEAINKLSGVQSEISSSLEMLETAQKSALVEIQQYANELGAQLDMLAEGSQAVAVGNEGLNAGLSEIAGKAPELQAGTSALNAGLNELNSGASALSEGSDQLLDGSKTLYEAVAEIDVDEDKFDDLLEYKDELEALMKDNDTFTGKTDTMEGKVKFIYKTNKQEKEAEVVEQVEADHEEKGFFNWLKNLFK
ncbi:MAG TPA: hypothetical protein VIG45_04810, partial [Erysipelothrix sp.]